MSTDIAIDSCVLIEFFRAKDKSVTLYPSLAKKYDKLFISAVVLYEVRSGLTETIRAVLEKLLREMNVLAFDEKTAVVAADLSSRLRRNRIQLASSDLFIAAMALVNDLPLATLNRKHFERIEDLKLV